MGCTSTSCRNNLLKRCDPTSRQSPMQFDVHVCILYIYHTRTLFFCFALHFFCGVNEWGEVPIRRLYTIDIAIIGIVNIFEFFHSTIFMTKEAKQSALKTSVYYYIIVGISCAWSGHGWYSTRVETIFPLGLPASLHTRLKPLGNPISPTLRLWVPPGSVTPSSKPSKILSLKLRHLKGAFSAPKPQERKHFPPDHSPSEALPFRFSPGGMPLEAWLFCHLQLKPPRQCAFPTQTSRERERPPRDDRPPHVFGSKLLIVPTSCTPGYY